MLTMQKYTFLRELAMENNIIRYKKRTTLPSHHYICEPRSLLTCSMIPVSEGVKPKSVIRISLCRTTQRNPNDRFGINASSIGEVEHVLRLSWRIRRVVAVVCHANWKHKYQE